MFMTNWSLWFHHKLSFADINNMTPWMKEAYVQMTSEYVEAENRAEEERQNNR